MCTRVHLPVQTTPLNEDWKGGSCHPFLPRGRGLTAVVQAPPCAAPPPLSIPLWRFGSISLLLFLYAFLFTVTSVSVSDFLSFSASLLLSVSPLQSP